jgi:hypothetical protein
MRRRLLPPVLAVPLALALAGGASAYIESTLSLFNADGSPAGDTVCEFYMEFNPTPGGETGSWELLASDQSVVASGPYEVTETEGDREPDTGTVALEDGTYLLVWDDETPVDASRREQEIVVECEAEQPSEAPTGSELPVETSSATPGGGVAGATGTPRLTPPPTDSAGAPSGAATTLPGLLVLIAGIAVGALVTTRRLARR